MTYFIISLTFSIILKTMIRQRLQPVIRIRKMIENVSVLM